MRAELRFAELKLTQSNIVLFGGVLKMNGSQTTIRLETIPAGKDILSKGMPSELVIMARGNFYVAVGHIASYQDGIVNMAFDAPVTVTQRRNRPRLPVQMPVALRSIHCSDCFGAWHNVESIDMSVGGMRLYVPARIAIAAALEVQFMIEGPTHMVRGIADSDPELAPTLAVPLIRASARLVHRRVQLQGDSIVGVAFTRLIPSHAMRVTHFCNSTAYA